MRNEYAMRAWFPIWNDGVIAAREAYELNRAAETDPRLRSKLDKELHEVEQLELQANGMKAVRDKAPAAPKLCRNKLHEMTPENTTNVARCIKCKVANEKRYYDNREARKRAARRAAA